MNEWITLVALLALTVWPLLIEQNDLGRAAPITEGSISKSVLGLLASGTRRAKLKATHDAESFWIQIWAAIAGAEVLTASGRTYLGSAEAKTAIPAPPASRRLNLAGAELVNQQWEGQDLSGANLAGANLSQANMNRANLSGAVLNDTVLISAKLSRATIMSALLLNADLTDADLSWANVSGADLTGARLTNTILLGVTWSTQTLWPDDARPDVERRSVALGPGLYQIRPVETDDRVLV